MHTRIKSQILRLNAASSKFWANIYRARIMYLRSLTRRADEAVSATKFAHQPPGVARGTFLVSPGVFQFPTIQILIMLYLGHCMGGSLSIINFPSSSFDLTLSGGAAESILGWWTCHFCMDSRPCHSSAVATNSWWHVLRPGNQCGRHSSWCGLLS